MATKKAPAKTAPPRQDVLQEKLDAIGMMLEALANQSGVEELRCQARAVREALRG